MSMMSSAVPTVEIERFGLGGDPADRKLLSARHHIAPRERELPDCTKQALCHSHARAGAIRRQNRPERPRAEMKALSQANRGRTSVAGAWRDQPASAYAVYTAAQGAAPVDPFRPLDQRRRWSIDALRCGSAHAESPSINLQDFCATPRSIDQGWSGAAGTPDTCRRCRSNRSRRHGRSNIPPRVRPALSRKTPCTSWQRREFLRRAGKADKARMEGREIFCQHHGVALRVDRDEDRLDACGSRTDAVQAWLIAIKSVGQTSGQSCSQNKRSSACREIQCRCAAAGPCGRSA